MRRDPVSPFEMFAIPSASVSPNGTSGGGGDRGAGGGGSGGLLGGGVEVSGGDPMLGGKSATAITLGSGITAHTSVASASVQTHTRMSEFHIPIEFNTIEPTRLYY